MVVTMFIYPAEGTFTRSFVCPLINDVIGKIEALGNIYVETIGKLFCVGEV